MSTDTNSERFCAGVRDTRRNNSARSKAAAAAAAVGMPAMEAATARVPAVAEADEEPVKGHTVGTK